MLLRVNHSLMRFWIALLLLAVAPLARSGVFAEQPGVVTNPYLGMALFEAYQGNYASALAGLSQARQQQKIPQHDAGSRLLLGELYLAYGQYQDAEAIFREVGEAEANTEVKDNAWFYLGKLYYQKQLYPAAEQALARVGGELEPELREELEVLKANLLMARGNHAAAADSLLEAVGDIYDSPYYFARYNLGVALIKSDRHREGVAVLRELGKLQTSDPELKRLRDKANLSLGFLVLKRAPVIASDFLRRITLDGAYANRALLGLGWAEVERQNYPVALVPLTKLRDKAVVDLAVYDAMLLVGNILERMDAHSQALQAYGEAIGIFERELVALDTVLASVSSGKLLDDLLDEFITQLDRDGQDTPKVDHSLAANPASRYLAHLLAGQAFQEGVKNLHDLHYLNSQLVGLQQKLPDLEYLITQREATFDVRLQQLQPQQVLAKLAPLQVRRDSLAAELERIARERDTTALATQQERGWLERLTQLEKETEGLATTQQNADLRERLQRLQGVLAYQLDTGYAPRYRSSQQQLAAIDQALREAQAATQSLEQGREGMPQRLADWRARLNAQAELIDRLNQQIPLQVSAQRDNLRQLVEQELRALRDTLREYLERSRMSQALLQDQMLLRQTQARQSHEVSQ